MAKMDGGIELERALRKIASGLSGGNVVLRVGFLEGATYPQGGKPVAMIAAIQEFGAPRAGIPPRPFFRHMIANHSGEWPAAIAAQLKDTDYNVPLAMDRVGAGIAGQLRQSIIDTNSPPLALSTIAHKGHSKPLIDTGHMINSIDHEVLA